MEKLDNYSSNNTIFKRAVERVIEYLSDRGVNVNDLYLSHIEFLEDTVSLQIVDNEKIKAIRNFNKLKDTDWKIIPPLSSFKGKFFEFLYLISKNEIKDTAS